MVLGQFDSAPVLCDNKVTEIMEKKMKRTLKRIKNDDCPLLNGYELRANSYLYINLPNGDKIRLYADKSGNYANVAVSSYDHKGRLETKTRDSEFDTFTSQTETIEGNNTNSKYTKVEFTAYCRKETDDDLFDLYYFCPNCNNTWNDEWSSYVDGECEECGATYTPYDSLEKRDAAVAVSKEDVPEKREELLWEEKFDFITEDGNEVDAHQKLCNVESDDGSIVDIEIVHHTSNRGTDYEYWELFVDGHLKPKSHWLYGDVEEAVYEVIEKRGLVVKPPVIGVQS